FLLLLLFVFLGRFRDGCLGQLADAHPERPGAGSLCTTRCLVELRVDLIASERSLPHPFRDAGESSMPRRVSRRGPTFDAHRSFDGIDERAGRGLPLGLE